MYFTLLTEIRGRIYILWGLSSVIKNILTDGLVKMISMREWQKIQDLKIYLEYAKDYNINILEVNKNEDIITLD